MGYGSYNSSDWVKLKNSRGITNNSTSESMFAKDFKDKYNPKYINVRESLDSADSPNSTPIIIGFDVTGSMGYLAAEIAKNSLNKTATQIYEKQPVTNPHILCAPFTQASPYRDDGKGSLQVSQFEADIRIVEQLLDMKVGFDGNAYSYDALVWYFAANHTKIDSFDKRRKKGFIFCIGDEVCSNPTDFISRDAIKRIYDDDVNRNLTPKEIYEAASEKYEIFHIVSKNRSDDNSFTTWNHFMPGRVAQLEAENIDCLAEVIISLMQIVQGINRRTIINQWSEHIRPIISKAIENIFNEPTAINNTSEPKKQGFFSKLFNHGN